MLRAPLTRVHAACALQVVIPSSAALRKQKLHHAVDSTPALEAQRVALVRSLLAAGSPRAACSLVQHWKLQKAFEPSALLDGLLQHRCYAAAMRFAREFDATDAHPKRAILRQMLEDKRYDAALKHASANCASVDGEHSPSDVLAMLLANGHSHANSHALALKYVHKFSLEQDFPPAELVGRVLDGDDELSVRTCGMLLKYVRLYRLEQRYPLPQLLERVQSSGVTVHEMDGKYVLKGRRRSNVSTTNLSSSGPGSQLATPGTSPPTLTLSQSM